MLSNTEIPLTKVLRPSIQEFSNFEDFVEGLDQDKSLQAYGMLKVVPPSKWKARKGDITATFGKLAVSSPIEQNVQGISGVYELLLIQKKSMKLNDYRKKVESFDSITDGKSIEEVEDTFWKSLAFSPPLYGADIGGMSLFDQGVPWNLNELPGVLKEGLRSTIAGINNPYLYIGSWKTLFGWHKEDLDLYAINFNHYGKPKLWYCIPPSEGKKLEDFAKTQFPDAFRKCREFYRHKTIMINPYLIKQKIPDLKIHKVVQYPGEFIVLYGGAYHAGFNWGFNIAEAVNFGTTKWLKMLPNAGVCKCVNYSVKIQYKEFFKLLLESTKYGKRADVKKLCSEHGITKGGTITPEKEEVKRGKSSPRKRSSSKKDDIEEMDLEDGEEEKLDGYRKGSSRSKSNTSTKGKRDSKLEKPYRKRTTKTVLARTKAKTKKEQEPEQEQIEGEESTALRISSRSKKIKKMEEDFYIPDWRVTKRTKTTRSKARKNYATKMNVKDIKQLVNDQKLEELVVENWAQCDKCNKWRIVKNGDGTPLERLLKKKKVLCSNIPGRDCDQPEDKSAEDAYVLPKNQEIIS